MTTQEEIKTAKAIVFDALTDMRAGDVLDVLTSVLDRLADEKERDAYSRRMLRHACDKTGAISDRILERRRRLLDKEEEAERRRFFGGEVLS